MNTPNRNDPCPCGSGKKFKKCCYGKAVATPYPLVQGTEPDNQVLNVPQDSRFLQNAKPRVASLASDATTAVSPAALLKQAVALHQANRLEEAITVYRRTLLLKPDYADAHNNLGLALQDHGDLDAAIECYRKALALNPDHGQAHSNLLLLMSFHTGCTPGDYLAEAKRYGEKVLAQARPYTRWRIPVAGQGARLRLGLVSGDLCAHPVACFLESFLMHYDPARFELVAYSTSTREDPVTARLKPHFAAWNVIAGLSDEAAARKMHGDGIHILLDLAGHTAHNRLPLFAWKPAPVQASWLGYFASTGVPGMDYLLADPVSIPASLREFFTETVWYLPETRLCFTPLADAARLPVAALPAERNGYATFGSFQRLPKLNDDVLALWGRVFREIPNARLRIQNKQMSCASTREHLLQRLSASGIAPERVTIIGLAPRNDNRAGSAGCLSGRVRRGRHHAGHFPVHRRDNHLRSLMDGRPHLDPGRRDLARPPGSQHAGLCRLVGLDCRQLRRLCGTRASACLRHSGIGAIARRAEAAGIGFAAVRCAALCAQPDRRAAKDMGAENRIMCAARNLKERICPSNPESAPSRITPNRASCSATSPRCSRTRSACASPWTNWRAAMAR
ncbi:MAG: tetratricopeptide repeat protein [Gallionellaceae bacterium]